MPPKLTLDYEIQQVQRILWEDFVEESKSGDRDSKYNDYKLKMAEFLEMKKGELHMCKRNLTPKTMTRWYRAPEVCFTEKYNKAIDIWSLGVTLSELIYCSTPYVSDNFDSGNRHLFKGSSSFPLSPNVNYKSAPISSGD